MLTDSEYDELRHWLHERNKTHPRTLEGYLIDLRASLARAERALNAAGVFIANDDVASAAETIQDALGVPNEDGTVPPPEPDWRGLCERATALLREVHDLHRRHIDDPAGGFEAIAEDFYRDTGYMAPGKDVPAAMNPSDEYMRERQVKWREWNDAKLADRLERQRDALAAYDAALTGSKGTRTTTFQESENVPGPPEGVDHIDGDTAGSKDGE